MVARLLIAAGLFIDETLPGRTETLSDVVCWIYPFSLKLHVRTLLLSYQAVGSPGWVLHLPSRSTPLRM